MANEESKKIWAWILVAVLLWAGLAAILPKAMSAEGNLGSASVEQLKTSQAREDPGLVACWHFDEGSGSIAYDSSGNGNHGTIYGATWTSGINGSALRFDGVNDYVEVPSLTPIQNKKINNFTFEAWVKYSSDTGDVQQIFEAHTSTYEIYIEGDFPQLLFRIHDDWGTYHDTFTTLSSLNVWYFIVGTYDGNTQRLYINGEEVSSDSWSDTFTITTGITLGKDYEMNAQYLDGLIDEVCIYNRALSADEIRAHYEEYAYKVNLTLEKSEIEGKKDNTVKATITVKQDGTGVPNITATVTFDKPGLSANTATTAQDGTAVVTITLTQDFSQDTVVKVTPKVAGTEYPNAAQNLTVKAKATSGAWTKLNPSTSPSPRWSHRMAPIYGTDKVLLFGGDVGSWPGTENDETWIFDWSECTWTQKTPTTSPSPRNSHAMASVYGDDKVVLFGGGEHASYGDTWIYDASENTWTQKTPTTSPSGRVAHGMASVWGDDKIVLFGGGPGYYTNYNDTWIYDVSDNTWTRKTPVNAPSPRRGFGFASVYGDDKIVLFGGANNDEIYNDTWIYDVSENTWTRIPTPLAPSPRWDVGMASLPTGKIVLFSGHYLNGSVLSVYGDTWEFDINTKTWTKITTDISPTERGNCALASIYSVNKVVLFGGEFGQPNYGAVPNETWVYPSGVSPALDVTMTLEKSEIEGKKDNTVKATITVKQDTAGVPNITATVTFDKSGLSANTATTAQDGTAVVTITLTQDFSQDTTVKVTPKVAGIEYPDKAVNLVVKAKVGYEVTMSLEKTEIEGKKNNTVTATITVKSGGAGVPNIAVTVSFDKSGLSANTATTAQDGTAVVIITLTQDFSQDTIVKVTPKVAGTEYPNAAKNLTVKAKTAPSPPTPGFEFLVLLAAIALVAGISAYTRRKEH